MGWYLLLDNNGQSYGVFIFSQESADEIIEEAKLRFVDAEAIQSLANYQNILCFYSTSTTDWPKSHVWKKYIHRADKILISGDNYYIACVKDSIDIDYNNLYFYNQMLTNASSTI